LRIMYRRAHWKKKIFKTKKNGGGGYGDKSADPTRRSEQEEVIIGALGREADEGRKISPLMISMV